MRPDITALKDAELHKEVTMKSYSFYPALVLGVVVILSSAGASEIQHKLHPKTGHKLDQAIQCDAPLGEGVINALDAKKSTVNILHKPKDSVGFEEMAMDFIVLKAVDISAFAIGERVHFLLKLATGDNHIIAAMCSLDVDESAHETCMTEMHEAAMELAATSIGQCAMDDMVPSKGADHRGAGKMDGGTEHGQSGHH